MSIARVETPSASSSNSSPGSRADASLSVAPQLRIAFRSTRLYSAASAAASATAPIRDLTRETDAGRLAWDIHTPRRALVATFSPSARRGAQPPLTPPAGRKGTPGRLAAAAEAPPPGP